MTEIMIEKERVKCMNFELEMRARDKDRQKNVATRTIENRICCGWKSVNDNIANINR